MGEVFTITATTNLSAGAEILVQVYSAKHFNGPKLSNMGILWRNWYRQGYSR